MFKSLLASALLFLATTAFSQTDSTLSQAAKNEKKILELQNKLGGISSDVESNVNPDQTIVSRLINIEKELDSLKIMLGEVNERSLKQEELNKKMDVVLSYLMKENEEKSLTTSGEKGDYYVVVEAQRTKEQIIQAQSEFQKDRNLETIVLKSTVHNFYYLALPVKGDYALTIKKVKQERAHGVEKAWWVAAKEVETL